MLVRSKQARIQEWRGAVYFDGRSIVSMIDERPPDA
jgi:hypothetical protein